MGGNLARDSYYNVLALIPRHSAFRTPQYADIQYNNTQYYDIRHSDNQNSNKVVDSQHNDTMLIVISLSVILAECCN